MKFDILVSSEYWNKHIGNAFSANGMFDIIFNTLHVGDSRSVAFWIGKERTVWEKDEANKFYVEKKSIGRWIYPKKKVVVWEDGFLQRHGYLETIYTQDTPKIRMFKILKGIEK